MAMKLIKIGIGEDELAQGAAGIDEDTMLRCPNDTDEMLLARWFRAKLIEAAANGYAVEVRDER